MKEKKLHVESIKSTISDQNNKYMSSFTFQFPWFTCTGMHDNPYYWDFIFPNQAELKMMALKYYIFVIESYLIRMRLMPIVTGLAL